MKLLPIYKRSAPGKRLDVVVAHAIIDDDFDSGIRRWGLHPGGYPIRGAKVCGRNTVEYLHRLVCVPPMGMETDHINRNPLDCRRVNLRHVSHAENTQNRRPRSDSRTGVRGVYLSPNGRFVAHVMVRGKRFYFGCHHTLEKAAQAVARGRASLHPFSEEGTDLARRAAA